MHGFLISKQVANDMHACMYEKCGLKAYVKAIFVLIFTNKSVLVRLLLIMWLFYKSNLVQVDSRIVMLLMLNILWHIIYLLFFNLILCYLATISYLQLVMCFLWALYGVSTIMSFSGISFLRSLLITIFYNSTIN